MAPVAPVPACRNVESYVRLASLLPARSGSQAGLGRLCGVNWPIPRPSRRIFRDRGVWRPIRTVPRHPPNGFGGLAPLPTARIPRIGRTSHAQPRYFCRLDWLCRLLRSGQRQPGNQRGERRLSPQESRRVTRRFPATAPLTRKGQRKTDAFARRTVPTSIRSPSHGGTPSALTPWLRAAWRRARRTNPLRPRRGRRLRTPLRGGGPPVGPRRAGPARSWPRRPP